MTTQIQTGPDSTVVITGEVAAEKFESFRAQALVALNQSAKIDGFRPGHIPEAVLRGRLGEEKILTTMAELTLQETYPEILRTEKIDAIGRPEIQLTKLAAANPLGFKITTAIYPSFTLPDYQALLRPLNSVPPAVIKVEEKEIDELVERAAKNQSAAEKPPPPPREQVKDYLVREKTQLEKDKCRLKILDELISRTTITLPAILIEAELDKMLAEIKANIVNLGGKFEDYLTHLKKTEAELKTDWREAAVKRVKSGLILDALAGAEKITPRAEAVDREIKQLVSTYPKIDSDQARAYITHRLTNEEVFQRLEEIK